mgnify:FL=1
MNVIALFIRAHEGWARWLGRQLSRRVILTATLLFCTWSVLDIYVVRHTSGISHSTFDLMMRSRVVTSGPDPRIAIIDIDEVSLKRMSSEFGRWPWPRDTLATVLDYLEKQGPLAIVWDVQFSDQDLISPGGDAAFNEAVQRSKHSHFSIARLLASTDSKSQITYDVLPSLWVSRNDAKPPSATVALIPPAIPAIAASKLGYNNGVVDSDGVLRHAKPFELLADGSRIQSIAMSVLSSIDPSAFERAIKFNEAGAKPLELIDWRKASDGYTHISFVDVFESADSGSRSAIDKRFQGKIVILGSTAASLHDIHPTPISAEHGGLDSLATLIDNAINERRIRELPDWANALIASALCVGLAYWVGVHKISSLSGLTLVLPAILIVISYLTLNGTGVFIDLNLPATLVLLFLSFLRYWSQQRRAYWCSLPEMNNESLALMTLKRSSPWFESELDRLIDILERITAGCKVIVPDVHVMAFQQLRWPELAMNASVIGPADEIARIRQTLCDAVTSLAQPSQSPELLPPNADRRAIASAASRSWVSESIDR